MDRVVEGLVRHGRGYANPLYGEDWWLDVEAINDTNYQFPYFRISNGINVPKSVLSIGNCGDAYGVYQRCAPLQAIIDRIAEALTNGTWCIKNADGDDVSKSSRRNKKIVSLLRNPNPLQTYTDFLKQVSLYRSIYGGAYIYANMPAGFIDKVDATSIWVFSPDEVETVYSDNLFSATDIKGIIKKYIITPKNADVSNFEVEPENVIFLYDTSETVDILNVNKSGGWAKRIRSLFYEIRNVMQAQEAIYSLNSDRGAQGIISNIGKDGIGFVPLDKEEKQRIQNRFRSSYGLRRDQDKILVTDAPLTYTAIGYNVKDLMLFEGVRENIMHMCDTFNYPFDLLASEKGKTAADKRTSMAGLYQDNIIPLSVEISGKLSAFFGLNPQEECITIDYSHLDIFQQGNVERNNSMRLLAQTGHIMFNGEVITREEFRRMLGLDPHIDENGTMRSQLDAQYARDDVRITTS